MVDPKTQKLVSEVALRALVDEWTNMSERDYFTDRGSIWRTCARELAGLIDATSPLRVVCEYDSRIRWVGDSNARSVPQACGHFQPAGVRYDGDGTAVDPAKCWVCHMPEGAHLTRETSEHAGQICEVCKLECGPVTSMYYANGKHGHKRCVMMAHLRESNERDEEG